MNRRLLALTTASAAATVAVMATPAFAEVAEMRWSDGGEASQEFRVAPGKFGEWCGKLHPGDKVRWRFEAPAPVNFNVHFHEGKDVRFPVKQEGVSRADGTLEVASEQDYCWMWTNKSAAPLVVRASASRSR